MTPLELILEKIVPGDSVFFHEKTDFKKDGVEVFIVQSPEMVTVATGVALNTKKLKLQGHVWCFVPEEAEDSGLFVEAVRFGVARDLPITFLIPDSDEIAAKRKARWHNYSAITGRNIVRYSL